MSSAPVTSRDVGLYVHYPYCERKCPYCDFNVHVVPHDDARYADAVLRELEARAPAYVGPSGLAPRFRSLYFGGGTPSEWAPSELGRVLREVRARWGLEPGAEITLEANPGTLAEARLEAFAEAGVTRLSVGAQSFLPHELEALGRTHDARAIDALVRAAQRLGLRVSLDLIYALPGQTLAEVERSLSRALALQVDHVSAYTLTIEPDTPLGRKAALGKFTPLVDDDQADLIEAVTGRLEAAGYPRYEVSSYAPPGREAQHNTLYWVGGAYLGVGAGAHSFLFEQDLASGMRRETLRAPSGYVEGALRGEFRAGFEEHLTRRDVVADLLFVGVRTRFGLDLGEIAARAGLGDPFVAAVTPTLDRAERAGFLERVGTRHRPTARGFLFTDMLGKQLLDAARSALPEAAPLDSNSARFGTV